MSDEPHEKGSILPQVIICELPEHRTLVRTFPGQLVAQNEVVLNEPDTVSTEEGPGEPDQKAKDAYCSYEGHPEPKEDVDLFVVEVDWKDTLDSVALDVAQVLPSDEEVTECDTRKGHVAFFRPTVVVEHLFDHVRSECVVLRLEDHIQNEQLTHHVTNVEQLRNEK